jgi:ribonuclease P protein component
VVPDIARLKRRSEFLRVAGTRRKWVAPGLILQVRRHGAGTAARSEGPAIRVGFTVSRKVGNAVARNRARRRLRAAVEQVMPVQAKEGYDFVVIGRQATLRRPFAALVNDLQTALRRLDACRDGSAPAAPDHPSPRVQ